MTNTNVSAAQDRQSPSQRRGLTIAIVALVAMLAFEAIGVTAAMPAVAAALDGLSWYALAFGAALAASVVGMVIAGDACDRQGPRPCFKQGMLLFGAGLLVAGAAEGMLTLAAGRLLQGLGSGMLAVAIYVALGRWYPDEQRPRMFALLAAAWVVPAVVGPALAALLVTHWGWRAVFLLTALLLLPTAAVLRQPLAELTPPAVAPAPRRGRLRWGLLAGAAAVLLNLLAKPGDQSSQLWLLPALAVVCVAAAMLLPAGTLRARRGLPTVVALRGLLASSFLAAEVFIPLWLTQQHGWSMAAAGVAISTGALLWSAGSWCQVRLGTPERRVALVRTGLSLVTFGIASVVVVAGAGIAPVLSLLGWAVAGFGIGLAFPTLSVLLLALAPTAQQGAGASSLQLSDALCSACVLALCGSVFALVHPAAPALAFAAVMLLAAAVAAVGALVAGRVAA